ncbi:hypothetical protein SDRG_04736 [Saprolegnia diclina VS20]|uniref:Uncharacterized protein n=1 Tax=Saprolegnia diclina (strain VS20) TaxID=1156394 RepID=T0QI80_SAPDV|nr:hypothetical protein SDRG_04736 [Saprolegnia diclina VS20]EQC37709.1 hypothetical protein SDRG_04736 [Saprolegnia diclina VS20]|eukprot:XP_008608642.1 hypothetical protein SDRG_04736 [Saprolegnia diclina VS20]
MDAPALAFEKEDCRCNRPLFDLKYLRTHRANSVKLIRCFPHCCPSHSYANFCATSIDLRATNAPPDVENDIAVVRFQTTSEFVYKVGDELDAQDVLLHLRRYDDNKAEWIPSEYQYYNKATQTMTYRFNHKNNLGWHYGWMGTSTKAHRTCTHQVVGYLLRKSGASLVVLAVTISPPFIVMSYRRACYHCQKHRESDADGASNATPALCECEGEFNVMQGLSIGSSPMRSTTPARPPAPPAHALLDPSTMERQLAILFGLLQLPPAHAFAPQLHAVEARLAKSLILPLGDRLGFSASRKRAMAIPMIPTRRPVMSPVAHDLISLKSCAVDLLLATLGSSDVLLHNVQQFTQSTGFLFVRGDLAQSYVAWLNNYYHLLNARLGALGTHLGHVAGHIAHAASSVPELHSTRVYLDGLDAPETANTAGFDYYVAQLREVYMADGSLRAQMASPATYSAHWVLDKVVGHRYMDSNPELDPSVVSLLRGITMGYSFQLRVTDAALQVRSDLHAFDTVWSEFVFDQVPRVFRVFPNGESSMAPISQLQHGDYVAMRLDADTVSLKLYGWPSDSSRVCYAVLLTLSLASRTLDVSVRQSFVAGPVDVASMVVEERCQQYLVEHEVEVLQVVTQYSLADATTPTASDASMA